MSSVTIHQSQSRGTGSVTFSKIADEISFQVEVRKSSRFFILEFRKRIFEIFDASGAQMGEEVFIFLHKMNVAWDADFARIKISPLSVEEKIRIYKLIVTSNDFGDTMFKFEDKQGVIDPAIYPEIHRIISEFIGE